MSGGNAFQSRRFQAEARSAFTLIELLVVISVIVLLMALLLPSLSRARKQARAVVCQNTCRNWGVISTVYTGENDGRLMYTSQIWPMGPEVYAYCDEFAKPSFLCPEAGRSNPGPAPDTMGPWTRRSWTGSGVGGKFTAWWHYRLYDTSPMTWRLFSGSYGMNEWIGDRTYRPTGLSEAEAAAFRDAQERMGTDPERSVVNEWCRSHDVKNLFVVDGSVFVTSGGVNPTNTIQALALHVGDTIKRRLTDLFD